MIPEKNYMVVILVTKPKVQLKRNRKDRRDKQANKIPRKWMGSDIVASQ